MPRNQLRLVVAVCTLTAGLTLLTGLRDEGYEPPTLGNLDGGIENDALLGDPGNENEPGIAWIVTGEDGSVNVIFSGGTPGDMFGYSSAVVGDINLDGFDDVLIGGPNAPTLISTGRAYAFFGPFAFTQPVEITADGADGVYQSPYGYVSAFGDRVGPTSDIDLDGAPDLRIGAWFQDEFDNFHTHTYIISGFTGDGLFTITDGDPFDPWADVPGDTNGDRFVDQSDLDQISDNLGLEGEDLTFADGEMNGDGVVDAADLAIAQGNLGYDHFEPFWNQTMPLPANAEIETASFAVFVPQGPATDPNADDDGDGIPNRNDPDSPAFDPFDPCSDPSDDCDGDGLPNFADPDWWFFHFRGECDEMPEFPDCRWRRHPGHRRPAEPRAAAAARALQGGVSEHAAGEQPVLR